LLTEIVFVRFDSKLEQKDSQKLFTIDNKVTIVYTFIMFTIPEAAKKLKISRQRAWKLVIDGKLKAKKAGGTWIVLDLKRKKNVKKNSRRFIKTTKRA